MVGGAALRPRRGWWRTASELSCLRVDTQELHSKPVTVSRACEDVLGLELGPRAEKLLPPEGLTLLLKPQDPLPQEFRQSTSHRPSPLRGLESSGLTLREHPHLAMCVPLRAAPSAPRSVGTGEEREV